MKTKNQHSKAIQISQKNLATSMKMPSWLIIGGLFSALLVGGVIKSTNLIIENGNHSGYDSIAQKIANSLSFKKNAKNTAGKIAESEYHELFPWSIRADLIEKTREVLYGGLVFEGKDPKNPNIVQNLWISELSAEHLATLLTYSSTSTEGISAEKKQFGAFSLLFLVGAMGEALTNPDIYMDQKVIVTLPNSEIQSHSQGENTWILSMDDIIPPSIGHIEYQGKIYIRKPISEEWSVRYRQFLDTYQSWRMTMSTFLKELHGMPRDQFFNAEGEILKIQDGMVLRLISESTYEKAENENDNVVLWIEELVRENNYLIFERKYNREIQAVSKKFPSHTTSDTKMLLRLVGRVNPDFSPMATGGLARMSEIPFNLALKAINHPIQRWKIEDELEILWNFYHTQIEANPEITAVAMEANRLNNQAKLTDKTLDIERQVRGLFFVLKTFLAEPPPPSVEDQELFRAIVREKLDGKEPTDKDIQGTYLNYAYLLQLQKQGIIPDDVAIERTDLVSMSDFVDSVNDLTNYLGIGNLKKLSTSLLRSWWSLGIESTIRSLSKYFWYQTHYSGNRLITLCMVNVRNWLSRLTGVKINGVGDMVEIHRRGIDVYAKEVERMFEEAKAKEKFMGYFPEFGKSNFDAPTGANLGMLFTDTRSKDGKRGGHVSALILSPDGQWLVKDDYHKWQLGPLKTVQDFYSEKTPSIWKKHDIPKNPDKLKGAIFFHGDTSKIAFHEFDKKSTLVARK